MNIKRVTSFVLVLILGLSVVGCGLGDSEDTVVAEVNGEKITMAEFNEIYIQVKENYNITEEVENNPEQQETIAQLKSDILEDLIAQKLIAQKAKDAGFVVTDDTIEDARQELEYIISDLSVQMQIMDAINETGSEDPDKDYMNEARAYVKEKIDALGKTEEEYIEFLAQQLVVERYVEEALKDVKASEQEVQEYYQDRLQHQKEDISILVYEDVELYIPEEARVKHILIGLPQEEVNEYNRMIADGKTEEAEQYLDEKLKLIEPRTLEALEKAQNGEDFEALIAEYGDDPGMKDNEEGYKVRRDGLFVKQFEETAFSLEEGEISQPFASIFGYHIVKLYEKTQEKVYTLDEKYDEIEGILSNQKKQDAFQVLLQEWLEEAEIKRYEGRL